LLLCNRNREFNLGWFFVANNGKAKAGKNNKNLSGNVAGSSKTKLIVILLLALLLVVGGGVGAAFYFLRDKGVENADATSKGSDAEQLKTSSRGKPRYVDLNPDFTISMDDDDARQFVLVAF